MGLSDELKIVISGDPKKFNKALEEVEKSTERLNAGLSAAAKISGVAFGALTGTITGLVFAFREQEIQEQKVARQLENTGNAAGMTAQQVFKYAASLQEVSIYGDEVILESQNILLGLAKLDQDGFKRASAAALDLATFMGGDLSSASQVLGKALANPAEGLAALSRAGIKFSDDQKRAIAAMSDSGNVAGAQAALLKALEDRYGGLAKANTEGTGKLLQLKNAMGDVSEEIGRQLTPQVSKLAGALIPLFKTLAENESFTRSAAATLVFATALAGLVFGVSTFLLGAVKFVAIVKAASAVISGISLVTVGWGLAIAAIAVAIVDLALNWDKRLAQMKSAFVAFVTAINFGAAALDNILGGLVTGNAARLKKGIEDIKKFGEVLSDTYSNSMQSKGFGPVYGPENNPNPTGGGGGTGGDTNEKKLSALTAFLEKKKALEDEYDQLRAEAQFSSQQQEELAQMEHQNKLLEAMAEYRAAIVESRLSDQAIDVEQEVEFQTQMQELQNELRNAELNSTRALALERAQIKQKADLQYIKDHEKFGAAYAMINKIMYSEQVQGAAQAASDLVALQQSQNSTLKAIGKAAAIADITIKTAQAAMNIFNGFSTIPIVGPALGVAGAAAAVAFGAERISQVTAAADGGMISGGIPGKDSVPAMLMPGELVTPTRNFDEVVNAVADSRLSQRGDGGGSGSQNVNITIGFTDDAFRIIEQKLNERGFLGV